MSIDKHKPVRARSQSFRSLKDQNVNRSKTNLQIPLIFSFEKDLPESKTIDNSKKRSSSSTNFNNVNQDQNKSSSQSGTLRHHSLTKKNLTATNNDNSINNKLDKHSNPNYTPNLKNNKPYYDINIKK